MGGYQIYRQSPGSGFSPYNGKYSSTYWGAFQELYYYPILEWRSEGRDGF